MESAVRIRYYNLMLQVEIDREEDGRFIAEVLDLPGVMAYGATREAALKSVTALAFRVIAERIEHDEPVPRKDGAPALAFESIFTVKSLL